LGVGRRGEGERVALIAKWGSRRGEQREAER